MHHHVHHQGQASCLALACAGRLNVCCLKINEKLVAQDFC